jgi:SagB-type dehydrogenase family enzyme
MSAGNLHPVEVYVVAGPNVDGVPAGVHHFAPLEFGLTELRRGDFRAGLSITAPVALVFTGRVWRTTWKYGERGWRHLYWDAGTMLANLVAAADGHGLETSILSGFADETVSRLVGIVGVDEVPLAVVTLGNEPADTELGLASNHDGEPLSLDVAPVAPRPIRLPLLVDAQAGSTLTADQVTEWRQAANAVSSETPAQIDSPATAPEEPIEAVILRRGSTRVMRHDSVAHDAMVWPLAAATRSVPLDAAPRGTLLAHYVNVHAVDGLRPGAYRWEPGGMEFIASDDPPREIGRLLCLDQPLGGDSAYTVFHNAALDPILDVLGSRGYRAAQLEAGIVSGRFALSAFALGLGATGLTFIDDLVSRYFQTATAPMLVTSVGVPDTPPVPAGRPGQPVTLSRRH